MIKVFLEKKLIIIENRDTIVAEKLHNPIVINDRKQGIFSMRESDFMDPLIEKSEGNYNTFEEKPWDT